jgi:hypothetical protein
MYPGSELVAYAWVWGYLFAPPDPRLLQVARTTQRHSPHLFSTPGPPALTPPPPPPPPLPHWLLRPCCALPQIVIASDDPMLYGYTGLTYDFWAVTVAWELSPSQPSPKSLFCEKEEKRLPKKISPLPFFQNAKTP